MPLAPPHVCRTCGRPGCTVHRSVPWRSSTTPPRIRGPKLQRLRMQLLSDQPFCRCGRVATIRDHIVPLAEGGLDTEANVQPLCEDCHAVKTQREAQRGMARNR